MVQAVRVKLEFSVDGQSATFTRNATTGRAELHAGSAAVVLQSPYRLATHFSFRTQRAWQVRVDSHNIEIVKSRPRLWAGFRANSFSVAVDGVVVATATGK